MNIPCTIFCSASNQEDLIAILEATSPLFKGERSSEQLTRVLAEYRQGLLRLTLITGGTSMDDMAKLQLGMMNWIQRRASTAEYGRELQEFIASCNVAVGCVFEPKVSQSDEAFPQLNSILLSICKKLDGVIFDGSTICDAQGRMLVGEN